jgi:Flp pilus assembly protein TadG
MKRLKNEKGQAMVEFAVILPILLILIMGIIDFGWLFYNQLALNNSCREGARFAVVNTGKQNRAELIENRVNSVTPPQLLEDLEITLTWSNLVQPLQGDITVKLDTQIVVLTPVLGIFSENQKRSLTAEVTMKVES